MKKDGLSKVCLKMNVKYKLFGIVCILLAVIFFIGFYSTTVKVEVLTLLIAVPSISLGLGLGVICYLYYKNHSLEYNEKEIIVTSLFGNKIKIYWDEILKVYSNQNSSFIVIFTKLEKIRIHKHLVGFFDFYDKLIKLGHVSR